MLKHLTEMSKAEVITVNHGRIQAINNSIAYIGFLQNFVGHVFAVDAKILASALKSLDEDFMCYIKDNKVIIFDSEREISFIPKTAEQMLSIPQDTWIMRNLQYPWSIIDKFVTPQYPGIKVTDSYFEAISDASIVRVYHHLQIDELENKSIVFAKCKLSSKPIGYCIDNEKLWIQYSDSNFVVINALFIDFPNTDSYFKNKLRYKPIPNLKTKLVPCDVVRFQDNNLVLYKEDAAEAIIENVEGRGAYDFKLFSKVIATADNWQFADTALFFSGMNFIGVIENVAYN